MLSFQRQLAVGKEGERQGLQMFHFLSLAIAESVVSRLQQGRHDLKGGREAGRQKKMLHILAQPRAL